MGLPGVVRPWAGVFHPPKSRALSLYGVPSKDNAFKLEIVLSGITLNFNLYVAAVAAGWDQKVPLNVTVTIQPSVVVGSSSTLNYAFDTGSDYPQGSRITLINAGYIVGRGGNGGGGGPATGYVHGGQGGPALRTQFPIIVLNSGIIGGGGGGGGGYYRYQSGTSYYYGGGGGAGYHGGTAGVGQSSNYLAGDGSLTSGGAGAYGNTSNGGSLGVAGGNGTAMWSPGAGGAAIVGNSNITWVTPGTILGSVS